MIKSRIVAALSALTISSTGLVLAATPASAAESEMFKVIQANLGSGHDNVDVGVAMATRTGARTRTARARRPPRRRRSRRARRPS